MPDMVELVKRAALEAMNASKPVHFVFGQVLALTPLKIKVDQKTVYTERMLALTRNVTDYELDVTISMQTEEISHGHPVVDTYSGGGTAEQVRHRHPIKGRKKIFVHNALEVGDWVLLARMQGGSRYVVLDRISPHPGLEGEWLDS